MAQRSLSYLILFPLFFFFLPILSSSSSLKTSNVDSASSEAERLIRSLNLFLNSGVNSSGPSSHRLPDKVSSSLVEKQFRLPAHGDPGTPIENLGHHAGYYRLPHSFDARMFYFFFESRRGRRSDPIVIWLNGGPGCSSSLGLFYENGPYQITNHQSLIWNDFGWDQVSNIIYVDQPTGTGFSYSSDDYDIRNDQESVSNDLYDFLQIFFEQHPQYLNNDFYITGESYAGHYIPALASRIHNGNKNGDGAPINLKGFAIGNGLTHPAIQYESLPDFALSERLITEAQAENVSKLLIPKCLEDTAICNAIIGGEGESCKEAHSSCTTVFEHLMNNIGITKNYYDFRKDCVDGSCYDFSYMEKLLNKASVRNAVGVGNIRFVYLNKIVYYTLLSDWMRNHAVKIPSLLEDGIKVLIYAGECDVLCNWLGIFRWVIEMKWSGQRQFNDKLLVSYEVDGVEKGELKEYGPLSFLKVFDAGHMVPMDQPKAALKMLERWTQGYLSTSEERGGPSIMKSD